MVKRSAHLNDKSEPLVEDHSLCQCEACRSGEEESGGRRWSGFFRFITSAFGFGAIYAAFPVCPFCGRQACPVGMASFASVGAFFALCLRGIRRFFG